MPEYNAQDNHVFAPGRATPVPGGAYVHVDCDRCPVRGAGRHARGHEPDGHDACDDCVVAYLLGRDADDAVVHDMCEERALRLLDGAGLLGEVVGRMDHAEAELRFATARAAAAPLTAQLARVSDGA
ncbi:MAG: hypothetical protein IT198_02310 [Acidimicrobiia bacterium]|nr:hypothetical protein [Acidimicrobiia bacterium]